MQFKPYMDAGRIVGQLRQAQRLQAALVAGLVEQTAGAIEAAK